MIEDHWLASPIFRLLALLITGYLSYELIPHRWLSYGLTIGGGCAFSLGALASLRGGRALSGVWGAQRQLSRGLRLGLYLLLILSSRLYYVHTMEQSTGGLLPLGGKLTAIIEAQEASPEPVGEGSTGTEFVGSRTEAVGRRIGEVGSALGRCMALGKAHPSTCLRVRYKEALRPSLVSRAGISCTSACFRLRALHPCSCFRSALCRRAGRIPYKSAIPLPSVFSR